MAHKIRERLCGVPLVKDVIIEAIKNKTPPGWPVDFKLHHYRQDLAIDNRGV